MSQIEQAFRQFLAKAPDIHKSYQRSLINRRSLARYLIQQRVVRGNQLEATIAMLRRFDFAPLKDKELPKMKFSRISLKDNLLILEFEKEKSLLTEVQSFMTHINYDAGDTFKIVIGSSSITLFIDKEKEKSLALLKKYVPRKKNTNISEISLLFTPKVEETKGTLAIITREFLLNDILIVELLTSSFELLIYLHEKDVTKAYEILKRLQEPRHPSE